MQDIIFAKSLSVEGKDLSQLLDELLMAIKFESLSVRHYSIIELLHIRDFMEILFTLLKLLFLVFC